MQTVNIHEAKTHLSRFVDQAASGEEILIARAGKPVARLVALAPTELKPRTLGLGKGRFTLPEHFPNRLKLSCHKKIRLLQECVGERSTVLSLFSGAPLHLF